MKTGRRTSSQQLWRTQYANQLANTSEHDEHKIFSEQKLEQEMQHSDPERREAALIAVDALVTLAELRSDKYELSYDEICRDILDRDLLFRDLGDPDPEISETAHRVWDAVSYVDALSDDTPPTAEDRVWMKELHDDIHARLRALRAMAGEQEVSDGGANA